MGIFGFLFIILPIILLFVLLGIGVTLVRGILRFFGLGRGTSSYTYDDGSSSADSHRAGQRHASSSSASSSSSSRRKKVIGDDEGEYVEFEEVE